MADTSLLGAKVRSLRRRQSMTQVELARRLGISPSYLNLIENNRRPLTAALLLRLAQSLQVDLHTFAASDDTRMLADLMEAFGDTLFEEHGLTTTDLRELVESSPNLTRAVLRLYRSYASVRDSLSTLRERLSARGAAPDPGRLPSEEVNDFIERRENYFPEVETAAEGLLPRGLTGDEAYRELVDYLAIKHQVSVRLVTASADPKAVRRFDPQERVLSLSEALAPASRRFQLAHQVGLITQSDLFSHLTRDEDLTTTDSRALARVALANYFAAALLMPYEPFRDAVVAERYDVELLAHRFDASFEQVAHRMTTLRRASSPGVPLHFLRIDIAGNISKRFSGSGIRFARFSGACPRWNVHLAFMTPGMIRVQVSRMLDGMTYFCVARTVLRHLGGYRAPHTVQAIGFGCDVRHARALVYADGIDLENPNTARAVGVTCRLCDRLDCEQRAFPAVHHPLCVDENVRGMSFYAPVTENDERIV